MGEGGPASVSLMASEGEGGKKGQEEYLLVGLHCFVLWGGVSVPGFLLPGAGD